MSNESGERLIWHRALATDELPEGRVSQVTCEHWTVCMTNVGGTYAALDNRCPHQGGPLGEGSIENGMLRCPWHGWDFDPLSGKPPGGFDDGVLLNNSELAKISKEQRAGQWDVWQTSLVNPDFAAYATNCGALGIRVTESGDLDAALSKAFAHDGPALVEIVSDPALI